MESNKRPCQACEGTPGRIPSNPCDGNAMLFRDGLWARRCPVCLGSGHVSHLVSDSGRAGQSMRDAEADAETLKRCAFEADEHSQFVETSVEARRVRHNLRQSGCFNSLNGIVGNGRDRGLPITVLAARAAFRAVPGLRGE